MSLPPYIASRRLELTTEKSPSADYITATHANSSIKEAASRSRNEFESTKCGWTDCPETKTFVRRADFKWVLTEAITIPNTDNFY